MKTIALSILVLGISLSAKAETSTPVARPVDAEVHTDANSFSATEFGPRKKHKHFSRPKSASHKKHGVGSSKTDRKRAKMRAKGSKCGDRRNRKVRGRH